MVRTQVAVASLVVTLALFAFSVRFTAAQGATPTPAATPTALPTRIPGVPVVRVINDLNGDGVRQSGEPGLAGWHISGGCSDAILPLTTDAPGEVAGGFVGCYRLDRQFGWLATSPASGSVENHPPDSDVTFLVHDLGRTVMEVSGEVILAGLPAPDLTNVALAPPFAPCAHYFSRPTAFFTYGTVIVSGADTQPGCPAAGQPITIVIQGETDIPAATIAFEPGQSRQQALVFLGDSMRLSGFNLTAATIDGNDCAVVVPARGFFVPEGFVSVFVLSEEVRPGCGAPGKQVRFYRDGLPVDPLLPWQAGPLKTNPQFTSGIDTTPEPTLTQRPRIELPNTGAGRQRARSDGAAMALALVVAGVAASLGASIRASRRPRR